MNVEALLLAAGGGSASPKLYVEDVFSTYLYAGNSSTQTINNGIDLAGQGGTVWVKSRVSSTTHAVFDTARGAASGSMATNLTSAAPIETNLTFGSSGFTLTGAGTADNVSGDSMVAWTFRKATKFHDVVTYTGNGGTQAITHSLGVTPGFVVVKRVDSTRGWCAWHNGSGGNYLFLNTTAAASSTSIANVWGDNTSYVAPTSSAITIGSAADVNANGATYVAYFYAHDAGVDSVIQCGAFSTDASGNAIVTVGWEPQFALLKATSTTGNWIMVDSMRGTPVGSVDAQLYPNLSNTETSAVTLDPTASGFNATGLRVSSTYVYMVIRRGPMKKPTSGTQIYNAIVQTGTGLPVAVTGVGFPPDLMLSLDRQLGTTIDVNKYWIDRLRGNARILQTTSTNAESVESDMVTGFDTMDGVKLGGGYTNGYDGTYLYYFLRRYPGVFDMVCYTGSNQPSTPGKPHNLGVVPELYFVKSRNASGKWDVYANVNGTYKYLVLNTTAAAASNVDAPTETVFKLSTDPDGTTFVAYLFASLAGISKVGNYTGNGTSQTIACNFAAGARFVLIKCIDAAGDWYVWDSVRGIVAANDPHLSLNSTAAEVTTDDSVDPAASGFIVNQNTGTNINVSGATYIYLAIA